MYIYTRIPLQDYFCEIIQTAGQYRIFNGRVALGKLGPSKLRFKTGYDKQAENCNRSNQCHGWGY